MTYHRDLSFAGLKDFMLSAIFINLTCVTTNYENLE